jgi:hypothetical protein
MATGQHHLNITIFDDDDELTHWKGSPTEDGGELKLIDMSPPGGPPQFDFDSTGNDRSPRTFEVETLILGETKADQDAFRAKYPEGKVISSDDITGLKPGVNYVIQKTGVTHSDGEDGSKLKLSLHEVGSANGATPIVSSGSGSGSGGSGSG